MLQKTLKAIPNIDVEEDNNEVKKFYTIEGTCKKCGSSPNSLIMYEIKMNRKDSGQSTLKTICLCCGHKQLHFASSLTT